jgi:uncharacterized membrane protein
LLKFAIDASWVWSGHYKWLFRYCFDILFIDNIIIATIPVVAGGGDGGGDGGGGDGGGGDGDYYIKQFIIL